MSRPRVGRRRRQLAGAAALTTVLAVTLIGPALTTTATGQPDRTSDDRVQVVMVDAPTVAQRNEVIGLGLDITEHATRRGIEVVLYDDADRRTLREAGFTWQVKVADLAAQNRADRRADRRYAASVARSPLPSGRTAYRTYEDYLADLELLAQRYPKQTRPLTLANETVLGEPIHGLEISAKADNIRDGKPVFLLMGAHHAREWPSSEHTMEFAFDLLQTSAYGDPRSVEIMRTSRLVIVPVVNVDGFQISRNAEPGDPEDDFDVLDYEMKRKNCSISENTPTEPTDYTDGPCDDNLAGRLRGTDLNRNYPGYWGGGGASTNWSNDTYRGDGPGSEPESDAVRQFISDRAVTVMISNHTYSNLVLRPPAIAAVGKAPDEPVYKALGDEMASHNQYTSQASYQLYDTSGSTEDWSYWITGGLGFTFEIGPDGFHPEYQDAVVGEYLGVQPAAGAGEGGNREAYFAAAEAAGEPALHSRIRGTAPKRHTITVTKTHISPTSPVIQPDGSTRDPIYYEDTLTNVYRSTGGPFTLHVNPSTRPLVAGRYGREPEADPQEPITLTNPEGFPAEGESEELTFEVDGLPEVDNGFAVLEFAWPGGADWDFYVEGPDGEPLGSGATLANPEVIRIPDPVAGTYTVIAENYEGGTVEQDWTGEVSFESPDPPTFTGIKEKWVLSCTGPRGRVLATRHVVVDRGETVDVRKACSRTRAKR
jgi:hypothetical protein